VTRFDMVDGAKVDNSGEAPPSAAASQRIGAADLAKEYIALRKYDLAEPLLRQDCDERARMLGPRHPDTLDAESDLGECLARLGQYDEAERHVLNCKADFERDDDARLPTIRSHCDRLARLYSDWGKRDEALEWRGQWARLRRREIALATTDEAKRGIALFRLAFILMNRQCYAAAEPPLRECLVLRHRALGALHRNTISTENFLGECLYRQGKYEEAEIRLVKSYASLSSAKDVPISWIPNYSERLWDLYVDWGKPDEALRWRGTWLEAKRTEIAALPAGTMPRANSLYRFGTALMGRGLFAEAETAFRDHLAIREQIAPQDWRTDLARYWLAETLYAQEKYAEAEPLLRRAWQRLGAQRALLPDENADVPRLAAVRLIGIYEALGRSVEADELRASQSSSP